ncbi:MAG: hypothetical protein U5J64_01240 [Halobacteriales archaeon]|nr:hypothetical protein [Halobacteriales archaeon]
MERRRFLRLAAGVSVGVASGCLGGEDDSEDEDGTDAPDISETAEFGYETWVPTGDYMNAGYADLARLREHGTLELDEETVRVVDGEDGGRVGPSFSDVDAYVSTDSTDAFRAYHGSFDADALAEAVEDELVGAERDEHRGYAVVRGSEPSEEPPGEETEASVNTQAGGGEREVIVADSFVVSSSSGTATRVVEAAVGEADREADTSELVQGLGEYADDPPVVSFNYGSGNTAYKFVRTADEGFEFVEVAYNARWTDEDIEEVVRRNDCRSKYGNETGVDLSNCRPRAERQGDSVVITTPVRLDDVESTYFTEGGLMP